MSGHARRLLPWALAAALLGGSASAQAPESGASGAPDLPPGPATLRVRVVHPERPEAGAGLPVLLYAQTGKGPAGLRGGTTDAGGAFVFAGIANDPELEYFVGVRYAGVPFGRRVRFAPGETERSAEVEVLDPAPEAGAVTGGVSRVRFARGCGEIVVHEAHELRNPGDRAVYVAPEARAAAEPILAARLPEGARRFAAPLAAFGEGLVERDGTALFWGPLYPGSQVVEFSYALPGRTATWERAFARGAERLEVAVPEEAPPIEGVALGDARSARRDVRDGEAVRVRSRGALAAGESVRVSVRMPEPGTEPGGPVLREARMWLELDDAALSVDEEYRIEVPGLEPVGGGEGEPRLCIPLPPGVEGLRLSPDTLAMGPGAQGDGALALRGPFPPGVSSVALRYRLPHGGDAAAFDRRFASDLPLLSVFVADTRVVPETPRLHKRRPVKTPDRLYLQLEAFSIEAGETVPLTIRRLPPERPLPRPLAAGAAALAAFLAAGFLLSPLRGRRARAEGADAATEVEAEREAVYAAIRDLDHDFETGKLTASDHARLRGELRARAVELVRAERAARAAPVEPVAAGPPEASLPSAEDAPAAFCTACGARLGAEWRFCARCGAPAPELPRAGESGGG